MDSVSFEINRIAGIDNRSISCIFGYIQGIERTLKKPHKISDDIKQLCLLFCFRYIYWIERYLSDKEKRGELALSPKVPMKYILSNHENTTRYNNDDKPTKGTDVTFGRSPRCDIVIDCRRCICHNFRRYPNNIMISRQVKNCIHYTHATNI